MTPYFQNDEARIRLLNAVDAWTGSRFAQGRQERARYVDCWNLVFGVLADAGAIEPVNPATLPHYNLNDAADPVRWAAISAWHEQYVAAVAPVSRSIEPFDLLIDGDVMFFTVATRSEIIFHCGIYLERAGRPGVFHIYSQSNAEWQSWNDMINNPYLRRYTKRFRYARRIMQP